MRVLMLILYLVAIPFLIVGAVGIAICEIANGFRKV